MGNRKNAITNNSILFVILIIITDFTVAQHYLTAMDFLRAANEEEVSFLTDKDFINANNVHILFSSVSASSRRVLSSQRFFKGDIRGKAAWGRSNHNRAFLLNSLENIALHNNKNVRHNGVASHIKKWLGGRIPYALSTEYTERERAIIAKAFQEYHLKTCIRFVPRSASDYDYLYIAKIDGCFSDVGRTGGRQELSLDNGCLHLDTIIHELMHSVGFYHEHERWDRDQFITILWPNIDREAYDQFGRVDLKESSYYGRPYDYFSHGVQIVENNLPPESTIFNNRIQSLAFTGVQMPSSNFNFVKNRRLVGFGVSQSAAFKNTFQNRINRISKTNPIASSKNLALRDSKQLCIDKSTMCSNLLSRCKLGYFEDIMRDYCPQSCGFCSNADKILTSQVQMNNVDSDFGMENTQFDEKIPFHPFFSSLTNSFPLFVYVPTLE